MQELKNNYGLTSFIGGLFGVVSGFNVGIVPIVIFIITLAAGIHSLKEAKEDSSRAKFAVAGIILAISMVELYSLFDWRGIIGSLILPKYL